jgi:hypothetical protein
MPKPPDRTMLSRLVDAYDRISEECLGMGDPEFHEIEEQLSEAIVDSPDRAVIKPVGVPAGLNSNVGLRSFVCVCDSYTPGSRAGTPGRTRGQI